jgi:voltage-gated potassium channel
MTYLDGQFFSFYQMALRTEREQRTCLLARKCRLSYARHVKNRREFVTVIVALGALLVLGTVGYMAIEGWTASQSFYMTVITLSTVGYQEVAPLSNTGRAFTSVLILVGIGVMFYTVTAVFGLFVEQGLRGALGRRRMERDISRVRDHFIVCGFGRVGREVAESLRRSRAPLVVVDRDPATCQHAIELGYLCIEANATNDAALERAGIRRARGIIAATASDGDNVFITLSAKALNRDVFVVVRACADDAVAKMEGAGANKVVMPLRIGGKQMAMMAMRPLLVSFIDTYFGRPSSPLELEDVEVTEDSPTAGKLVSAVEEELGLSVLAIRKATNELTPKPSADVLIEVGDELVVVGRRRQLEKIEVESE